MASARVLAIWCMDWPAVAAAAAAGLSATAPVAVTLANRVIACSATARAAGVRRGLRRREAAARCPQLFIATADADRDARLFEGVIAAVDDLVPRAELLRPGLLVLPVRGPARFFGSEQMAAERLIDAVAAHRFARGEPERAPCGREPPPDLAAELACDPPIDRVDAAAFAGRSLAAELHRALMAAGVGCTRLAIHAVTANGEERSRVWRCAEPLTEDATADRVRWQLDGWLNNRNARDRPTAAVTLLRLQAVETVSASEGLQLPLWGGLGEQDRLRARRALVRVQGLLGPEAVRVPVLSGGHGPAERITLTVLGLVAPEPVPQADPGQPWPGRLPDPSPAVLFDDPVDLLDAQGNPIRVTSRGMFSADPARLRVRGRDDRLRWWAGPWPDDERWWDPDRASGRTARAQVLLDGDPGTALLLCYRQRRWYLEGSYE